MLATIVISVSDTFQAKLDPARFIFFCLLMPPTDASQCPQKECKVVKSRAAHALRTLDPKIDLFRVVWGAHFDLFWDQPRIHMAGGCGGVGEYCITHGKLQKNTAHPELS